MVIDIDVRASVVSVKFGSDKGGWVGSPRIGLDTSLLIETVTIGYLPCISKF